MDQQPRVGTIILEKALVILSRSSRPICFLSKKTKNQVSCSVKLDILTISSQQTI
jgi:hypothetical protein